MTGKEVARQEVERIDPRTKLEFTTHHGNTDTATIQQFPGGWHSVQYGSWQVSVSPDALLQLPRHLKDSEVDDFVCAILAAREIANNKRFANESAGAKDSWERTPSTIVTQGVPVGATRAPTVTSQQPRKQFTPEGLAKARAARVGGSHEGNTSQRPRVPLPPAPRYPRQLPPSPNE